NSIIFPLTTLYNKCLIVLDTATVDSLMKPPMPAGIAAQFARRHSCVMRLKAGVARLAGVGTMDDSASPAGSEAAQRHKTAEVFANVYADCAGEPPVPLFFYLRTCPAGQRLGSFGKPPGSPLCAGFAHHGVE